MGFCSSTNYKEADKKLELLLPYMEEKMTRRYCFARSKYIEVRKIILIIYANVVYLFFTAIGYLYHLECLFLKYLLNFFFQFR